jgi:hypothetical protein
MRLSREEAVSLLNKWMMESVPVSGSVNAGGMSLSFRGFISDVTPAGFKIAQSAPSEQIAQMVFEVTLPFAMAQHYDYKDIREAPAEDRVALAGQFVVSRLQIDFYRHDVCAIFEREKP